VYGEPDRYEISEANYEAFTSRTYSPCPSFGVLRIPTMLSGRMLGCAYGGNLIISAFRSSTLDSHSNVDACPVAIRHVRASLWLRQVERVQEMPICATHTHPSVVRTAYPTKCFPRVPTSAFARLTSVPASLMQFVSGQSKRYCTATRAKWTVSDIHSHAQPLPPLQPEMPPRYQTPPRRGRAQRRPGSISHKTLSPRHQPNRPIRQPHHPQHNPDDEPHPRRHRLPHNHPHKKRPRARICLRPT